MPCRYDPTPEEIRASAQNQANSYKKKLDKMTAENDMLRETLLDLIRNREDEFDIPAKVIKVIEADQIKHRKQDLQRVGRELRKRIEESAMAENSDKLYAMLGRVAAADTSLPLEPQLGFSPDEF